MPDYRPVSRLAVAALALGVASPVVFVAPVVAIVVPIAGVVTGASALLRIRRDASLAGRTVAIAGLMLAVFSLSGGPTYWLLREWQLRSTAEQFALSFVERLIEGDTRSAHQMTLAARRRFTANRALADSYRDTPGARDDLSAFVRDPFVRRLRSLGGGKVGDVSVAEHDGRLGFDWFAIHLDASDASSTVSRVEARLLIERSDGPGGGEWRVGKFVIRDAAPTTGK